MLRGLRLVGIVCVTVIGMLTCRVRELNEEPKAESQNIIKADKNPSTQTLALTPEPLSSGQKLIRDQKWSIEIKKHTQWDKGYCAHLAITNLGAETLEEWEVQLRLNDARIIQAWNLQKEDLDQLSKLSSDRSWPPLGPGYSNDKAGICVELALGQKDLEFRP